MHFRRSPVKRAKRHGMLRNVCVALGNWGAPETVDALVLALHDPQPLPRAHAAWALGRVWVQPRRARGHRQRWRRRSRMRRMQKCSMELRLALRGEA